MEEIRRKICIIIKEILEIEDVTNQSKIDEIGFDSFKFIQLVVSAEECFEIEFEDEYLDFHQFETVEELVDYIDRIKKNGTT